MYASTTERRYPLGKLLELVSDRVFSVISRDAHHLDVWGSDIESMPGELGALRFGLRELSPDHIWIVGRKESAARGLQLGDYFEALDHGHPAVFAIPHPGPGGQFWGKPENAEAWEDFVSRYTT